MIHKLYVNAAGWSNLDIHFDKGVIINKMAIDNKKNKHTYYMIVDYDDKINTDVNWDVLRNQEEIDHYISAYNERKRLDNMSVLELKKYMVKKMDTRNI